MNCLGAKHFEVRYRLAHPDPDDEIVISGMSGCFPNSRNVVEYGENIKNKINLCNDDERRSKHVISEVPRVTGKMFDVASFDAGFFGIHELHAHARDPMHRLILERVHEAILDAGIAPEDLVGTRTGVFIANSGFDAQKYHMFNKLFTGNNAILGFSKSILAQHISYFYKLNGPSMCLDSACSSGLYTIDLAYMAIRNGTCDRAIVGGCGCLFNNKISLQFMRLGVLNTNGECRPFDDNASGYTRSEAICVLILEKSKDSKRVYAKIVHSKTNIDGFKDEGITYPSRIMQLNLLREAYNECCVPLEKIGYFEAHGTGTNIGDIEELCSIDAFFNKKERNGKQLIIGSVKGNIGHTEQVAGLSSIIKVIYGMERDVILPNIHYESPRRESDALLEGRLKVATKIIPWPEDAPYSGINAFGFGGANGHVILKRNKISKTRKTDKMPRLVCFSGRTNEAINTIQEYLNKNEINNDLIGLLHSAYSKRITNNAYRGFSVLSHLEKHKHSSGYCFEEPKHLGLCIGDAIKINMTAFTELNNFPIFKKTVQKFLAVLQYNKININIFSNSISQIEELMFTTCIQLGIVDILNALDVVPTYITANSMGYFIAAYADQALSFEEVIIFTYKLRKLFTHKDLKIDTDLKDELTEVIALSSKMHERYLEVKTNPYDFRTIEYFIYNLKNPNSSYNIEKGMELRINGSETKNIKLITPDFKLEGFLQGLGRLYEAGFELNLLELYPKCSWPVPRGTPMISPLVKWEHCKQYELPNFEFVEENYYGGQISIECNLNNYGDSYLKGHLIDGRILFPGTAYIMYIARVLSTFLEKFTIDQMVYQFSNVKFHKAITFGNNGGVKLTVLINKSGHFEISETDVSIVTGEVLALNEEIQFEIPEYAEADIKMDRNDIYKELRLRGYNYSGEFCGIKEICGNKAILKWSDNFVTFLDSMLQFHILQKDDRSLYALTGIDKLTINIPGHKRHVKTLKNDEGLAIFIEKNTNILRTEFIEIIGVQGVPIARKKQIIDPILETYRFIPNESELSLDDALRVNTKIILENSNHTTMSLLENITEEREPFASIVMKTIDGQPLILYNIKIISDLNIDFGEVNVVNEDIQMQSNNNIFIGTNLLAKPKKMETALATLVYNGFIITFETALVTIPSNFIAITKYTVPNGILYLLSKASYTSPSLPVVHISSKDFKWMNILKSNLHSETDVIIYSENDLHSGIIGFSNCLRYECKKNKIYTFFLNGAPDFDKNSVFYKSQLTKNLRINVYRNGEWGTYRHMLLNSTELIQTEHCFANVIRTGDLNSLSWIAGPLSKKSSNIVDIHYSSINFKDLMIASGKLSTGAFPKNPVQQDCFIGCEFSGVNQKGERIMGIVQSGIIASFSKYVPELSWIIPRNWSLEEASTVPVVYSTVLFAFKFKSNIKKGESILIHSGTGGIGLSAINLALHYGLTVYTTVGTLEKREFLIQNYPQLDSQNIGYSRDTSFEQMIFKRTKGLGVDYVLNSLADEKLLASVRCLKKNGTFLEIGKFDLWNNSELELEFQNKGISFVGVMLDRIIHSSSNNNKYKLKTALFSMVQHGINTGYIKPLPTTCFQMNQLQEAFKYIGTGKHIGKVIFKINTENRNKSSDIKLFSAIPRVYFNPRASYILIGGLGGFGLELVDWMVTRGARNFILSSRNGPKTGYQTNALKKFKTYGVRIEVLQDDVTKLLGCLNIVNTANTIAPIEGIFNLAVDLRDGIFDNLTENDYKLSLNPKAVASMLLDEISKIHCPRLKHFILFSSLVCGRGNAGQTNYGLANSIMERLCERRKIEGFPALAIQWGAIGDVGLMRKMHKEQNEIICGCLQQKINSCLEVLDKLLYSQEAVVGSIVVAEKTEKKRSDNVLDAVLDVIGIRDINTISPYASLPELGMDSMMAVEIKNILERDYNQFLTSNDIKSLTVNKLLKMQKDINVEELTIAIASFNLYIDNFFNSSTYKLPKIDIVKDIKSRKVFFFPGIEGVMQHIENLMVSTSRNSTCFQYITCDTNDAAKYVDGLWPYIKSFKEDFQLIAHSTGTIFALELAAKMESQGHYGKIVFIDGSPDLVVEFGSFFISESNNYSDKKILANKFNNFFPTKIFDSITKEQRAKNLDFSSLLQAALNCIPAEVACNKEMMFDIFTSMYKITKMAVRYKPSFTKIKSKVILIVPTRPTINNFADDLYLSKYCENILSISTYEGDHSSIVNNSQVHDKIKEFINN